MIDRAPRLRVERLVIVESRSPRTFIRDITRHAGLNIVWAEELAAADGGSEVQRAGHGVGKSTFSLMLQAELGDDGAAVKTMCNHLAKYYGSGGNAAEVVVGSKYFAVLRSFGSPSFAFRDANVEQLFEDLHVILTTAKPPQEPLRDEPTRILKLSRATEEDLLLKRRIENLLARATPSSRDEEEGAS